MRRIVAAMFLAACGAPAPPTAAPTASTADARAGSEGAAEAGASAATAMAVPAPGRLRVAASSRLPIGTGPFGAAAPTVIRRVDKGERWMALCQARNDTDNDGKLAIHSGHHGDFYGDQLELFLVLGGGEGTRIDAMASASADGRWIAAVRGTRVDLVDSQTGEVFALPGADAAPDGRPGAPHRAAMFAKDRLLYIRQAKGGDLLVVRDPRDHAEREIRVPGRIWRIDGGGDRLVRVYTIPEGAPFPQLRTTLGEGECIGPPRSYGTYGSQGPKPVERWIDLDAGKEVTADAGAGAVAVGATLVRTPSDGALYFDDEQIAPPACKVQLLAVLASPVRAIAICGEKKRAKVVLLGKGLRKELASTDRDTDHYSGLERALDPAPGVVCDGGLHCVATATNQYIDLKGGVAQYAWGSKLYVVHATMSSRKHEIIDVVTGARAPIASKGIRFSAGKYLVDYDDNLVDLDAGKVLGKAPAGAVRLGDTGRVLTFAKDGHGPLTWAAP